LEKNSGNISGVFQTFNVSGKIILLLIAYKSSKKLKTLEKNPGKIIFLLIACKFYKNKYI